MLGTSNRLLVFLLDIQLDCTQPMSPYCGCFLEINCDKMISLGSATSYDHMEHILATHGCHQH